MLSVVKIESAKLRPSVTLTKAPSPEQKSNFATVNRQQYVTQQTDKQTNKQTHFLFFSSNVGPNTNIICIKYLWNDVCSQATSFIKGLNIKTTKQFSFFFSIKLCTKGGLTCSLISILENVLISSSFISFFFFFLQYRCILAECVNPSTGHSPYFYKENRGPFLGHQYRTMYIQERCK